MVKVLKKIKDLQGEAMHVIKVDIDKNPSVASHFFHSDYTHADSF